MEDIEEVTCRNCGSINDATLKKEGMHLAAYCNGCSKFIKNISYAEPTLYFGKYSQTKVAEIDDLNYLEWLVDNVKTLKPKLKEAINAKIIKLKNG